MPKKYRPTIDDYVTFSFMKTMYGLFRPIEDKLRAAGYTGPIFADFDNTIYQNLNIDKTTPLDYNAMIINAEDHGLDDKFSLVNDYTFKPAKTLSRDEAGRFRDYVKKIDNYLDLIIKNTPPDEYKEELAEVKYYKSFIRAVKVFGGREVWRDKMGFLLNASAYDADIQCIEDIGNNANPDKSRELWRQVKKHYPYTQYRDAITNLTNLACDYEENEEKNTFVEQIEYRENYKKALQDYLSAWKSMAMGDLESERIAKLYARESVIAALKQADGPDKDIDYLAIINRVEEQEKAGLPVDPNEKSIYENIKTRTNNEIIAHPTSYAHCNSRFGKELAAMGFKTNEMDFTGKRGAAALFPEIEAQINDIDMGWPVDELVHIERLSIILRKEFGVSNVVDGSVNALVAKCKTFYEQKVKDKPYPTTKEGRDALYQEFYALGQEASEVIKNDLPNPNNPEEVFTIKWDAFRADLKKTMDKPLNFAQHLVVKQCIADEQPVLSSEGILAIKNKIDVKKRFGHIDSSEFDKLQKAFNKFARAFNNDKDAFKLMPDQALNPEVVKLLKEVREAARAYLKEKDKEAKKMDERSTMGKNRYDGAAKAYRLVDKLIRENEKRLEDQAKKVKEFEDLKGRKETREAFFKTGTELGENSNKFDVFKAGGEDKLNELKAANERRITEAEEKEPVTDAEKYEKLINSCRVKLDDPVASENAEENEALQNSRVDKLALMFAAMEMQEEGIPFDRDDVTKRSEMLKNIYSMDKLKKVTENLNGPKILKDALTFKFKAAEVKKNLEEPLYEVGKAKYSTFFESQNKYQHDLATVLNRKSMTLSSQSRKIVDAMNEIMRINLKDKSLIGINAYKLRKANVKLMKAIVDAFDPERMNKFDKDAFGPKLALDTLAVLTTYTGCQSVTRKFLQNINTNMMDGAGHKHNIDIENFTNNYGVNHSRNVSVRVRQNANANPVNNPVNHM